MSQEKVLRAVGEQILIARRRAELSQQQVARRIGMHPVHLSKIERGVGGNTGVHTLYRIAVAVGVPVSQLVSGLEE